MAETNPPEASPDDDLAALWRRHLRLGADEPVDEAESFLDRGDSMQVIRLLVEVTQSRGATLDFELFFERPTLEHLRELLADP